jgi:hypothetical protein
MENIEVIGASVHLGKKSSMAILDAQYPVLDLHTQAILIQLYQVDDGVSQCGNVVDTGEQPVLASLSSEEDGAHALDLHGGGVPELDGASDDGVELGEELSPPCHVVGGANVEVPVPRKAWALGSSRWSWAEPADLERGKLEPFSSSPVSCRNSMHPCTKNRAEYSSSACATWACPSWRGGRRQSFA